MVKNFDHLPKRPLTEWLNDLISVGNVVLDLVKIISFFVIVSEIECALLRNSGSGGLFALAPNEIDIGILNDFRFLELCQILAVF